MKNSYNLETSGVINLSVDVRPLCFNSKFNAELEMSNLSLRNEGKKMLCSIDFLINFFNEEDPREFATVRIVDPNVYIHNLSDSVEFVMQDDCVEIETINASSESSDICDALNEDFKVQVVFEGIQSEFTPVSKRSNKEIDANLMHLFFLHESLLFPLHLHRSMI